MELVEASSQRPNDEDSNGNLNENYDDSPIFKANRESIYLRRKFSGDTAISIERNSLDIIIEKYGFGWITIQQELLAIFLYISSGMEFGVFIFLVLSFKAKYDLTSFDIQLISNSFFIGGIAAIYLYKFLKDFKDEVFLCKVFMFLVFVSHFLLYFIENIYFIFLLRFLSGLFTVVKNCIGAGVLIEFLPIRYRGICLSFPWIGYQLGSIILLYIMLYSMPNMEPENLQMTLLYSSTVSFLSYLGYVMLNPVNGPRSLILKKQYDQAFEVIEKFNNGNSLNDLEKQRIISQVDNESINSEVDNSISSMFIQKYFLTTILLLIVRLLLSILIEEMYILVPITLESLKLAHNRIILDTLTVVVLGSFRFIISGPLMDKFGRGNSLMLCSFLSAFFILLCIIWPSFLPVMVGLELNFIGSSQVITNSYVSEIYPSRFRVNAITLFQSVSSAGFIISQILAVYLNDFNLYAPYYVCFVMLLASGVIVYFLPLETKGKAIDK